MATGLNVRIKTKQKGSGLCPLFFLLKRGDEALHFPQRQSGGATALLAQLHHAAPLLLIVVDFYDTTIGGGGGPKYAMVVDLYAHFCLSIDWCASTP